MINKEVIYNYDVFISYRHLDDEWSKWLLESLETWKVPKELVKKGFPERIGRVFRDEEELSSSSNLTKSIEKALIQSKYLVVICSKETPKSKWVEAEIKIFKELGRSDRIIVMLIDGEPSESISEELRYIDIDKKIPLNPIIADVRDKENQKETKQKALLQILSCVLACDFKDLIEKEKIREKIILINKITILLCFLIIIIFSIVLIWKHNKVKLSYYNDFVYQYGVPKGIGKLTKKQYHQRASTYIFEHKKGILKRVKRVNSYGILDKNYNISIWIPEIDSKGNIKRIICKDHNNKIVMIKEYSSDLKIITFQNEFNLPFIFNGNSTVRYKAEYNENGYITNELYYKDSWNTPISDKNGFYGKQYEVDESGVITAEYGINSNGNIIPNKEGIYKIKYTYDDNYNLIKEEFTDKNDNLIYIDGYDYGYSYIIRDYDINGNLIKKSYFNENKQRILKDNYKPSYIVYNIDRRGNTTNIINYDENGKLFLDINYEQIQYHTCSMLYDNRGNIIETSFYNLSNDEYVSPISSSKYKMIYDENNNIIEKSYYDKDNNLVNCFNKYSILKMKYDSNYNLIEESYYNTNKEPTVYRNNNYHKIEYEYDDYNNLIEKRYFDIDGKLVVLNKYGNEGYEIKINYDKRGNIIEESYNDQNGKLILNSNKYALKKIEYNEIGLKTEESYYGTNNEAVLFFKQSYYIGKDDYTYHKIKYKYDDLGNNIETSYYDTNDKLIITELEKYSMFINAAKIKYEYSNFNLIKESYYGINNEPINAYSNLGIIKYEYTDYRAVTNLIKDETIKIKNIIKTSYYDKDEKPILSKYNYHAKYIGKDNDSEINIYCGTNNELVINNEGNIAYSIENTYYDSNNYKVRTLRTFGTNNEPVIYNNHCFKFVTKYFGNYDIAESECYGTNNEPILGRNGYFKYEGIYDDNYNLVSYRLYGTNNQLTLFKNNYARVDYKYDKNNRKILAKYYGTNEKPIMNIWGYASYKITYDSKENAVTNYYDDKGKEIRIID